MPKFEPNGLQKALFVEVMNAGMSGVGDSLARRPEVMQEWLLWMEPVLSALADLGRAAVRNGRSDHGTMVMDFTRAMDPLPHAVLCRLEIWKCLRDLVSADALTDLEDTACRERFQTLATLDAGL